MNRLIQRLAQASHTNPAEVADEVQTIVNAAMKKIRNGHPAKIPGLGEFFPGPEIRFVSEKKNDRKQRPNRSVIRPGG